MKLLLPVNIGLPQLWLEDSKCSLVKVSSSVASEENQIRVKTTSPGLTLRHSPVCTDTELGRYLANWVQFVFTFSRATLVWSMSSSLRMFSTTMVTMATPSTCTVYSTVQYSTVQCPLHLLLLPGEQPQHVRVTGEPVLPPDLGQHVHLCRYLDS